MTAQLGFQTVELSDGGLSFPVLSTLNHLYGKLTESLCQINYMLEVVWGHKYI